MTPTNDKVDQSGADERAKFEQPWNDHRIKLNGIYIGCGTKANADQIIAALQAQPSAPANQNAVRDALVAKMFGSFSVEDGDGDAYYNRGIDKCIQIVQAMFATPANMPASDAAIFVEARECTHCRHIGINDADEKLSACVSCDWSGPSPIEDHCAGCGRDGTMTAACPKCGSEYELIAEADIAAAPQQPVAASEPVDGGWYWVQKEDIDRIWKWYPAQLQRSHWNSAQFSGIPLFEVKVGAAISSPSVQAKALTDERAAFEAAYAKLCCVPNTSDEDAMREMVQANRFALVNGMNWRHSRDEIEEYRDSTVQRSWAIWQARALLASQPSVMADVINNELRQATLLAQAIWEKHHKDTAPHWKPAPDLMGLILQIDNMTCRLTSHKPSAPADVAAVRDAALEEAAIITSGIYASNHLVCKRIKKAADAIRALKSAAPTAHLQATKSTEESK